MTFFVRLLLDVEAYLSAQQQCFRRIVSTLKDFVLNGLVRGLHYLDWHTLDQFITSLVKFDFDFLTLSIFAVCKSDSIFESNRDLSQRSSLTSPFLNSHQNINFRKGLIDSDLSYLASALNHDISAELIVRTRCSIYCQSLVVDMHQLKSIYHLCHFLSSIWP